MCGGEDQDQPLVQPVELKVFSKKKNAQLVFEHTVVGLPLEQ
jgi:hypothetical protein